MTMSFTLQHATPAFAAMATGWLMVRMGTANGLLVLRAPSRCAACGRRRTRGRCKCSDGAA